VHKSQITGEYVVTIGKSLSIANFGTGTPSAGQISALYFSSVVSFFISVVAEFSETRFCGVATLTALVDVDDCSINTNCRFLQLSPHSLSWIWV
jgi:hypothetical protein